MSKVRVRYAPSPTGLQHVGGIRTALFNWLFARHNKGDFIWRVEDTDRERFVKEAVDSLADSLKWLGLSWDEGPETKDKLGPYLQSERLEIYKKYADQLLKTGKLYRDWTSPPQLEKLRKVAQVAKKPFLARQDILQAEGDEAKPHVLRFKVDLEGKTSWRDVIRGEQTWQNDTIDDFIVIKSDGYPTYNFANVIDDHLMEVSHVLRGDEFLASTPKHLLIYEALGWQTPEFGHLAPVMDPDGKAKLSKRHGAQPATYYRDEGYLAEALLNFLASLGWNDGTTQEVFSLDELIAKFSLERVQKSPAVFDKDRLDWLNAQHIRRLSIDELFKRVEGFWPEAAKPADDGVKKRVLEVLQDRLKVFHELPELSSHFFSFKPLGSTEITKLTADFKAKVSDVELKDWLNDVIKIAGEHAADRQKLEAQLKEAVKAHGGNSMLWIVLREVLSGGEDQTPPIWDMIYALGKDEATKRLESAKT